MLFSDLKQYEEAIPRLEEVHLICRKVFGDKHERTVNVAKDVAFTHMAQQSRRGEILWATTIACAASAGWSRR